MEVCQFKDLEELSLSLNKIATMCTNIGTMNQLRLLNLHSNPMTELPESLRQLDQLEELNIWYVQLKTNPDFIEELENLKRLGLTRGRKLETRKIINSIHQSVGTNVEIFRP